ncbi:MAG: methyltransferase type 11 [Dolichospermum sp.]|nr:methyltransferase type 11 [Dolichospermum sp.]
MLRQEAVWLSQKIYSLKPDEVFPLLNIGSSTKTFREKTQPWIDTNIFNPARENMYPVIHMDLKKDDGVDIAGDIRNPDILQEIANLNIKSVMCSNLLEHLSNREEICEIIYSILPIGGYLFLTVPCDYPYHPDPIDTMFRPDIDELKGVFPTLKMLDGDIVHSKYNGTSLPFAVFATLFILRLMLPVYKPHTWRSSFEKFPYLFKKVSATCIVLQKL